MTEPRRVDQTELDLSLLDDDERVCAEFEAAWQRALAGGPVPRLETYLDGSQDTVNHKLHDMLTKIEFRFRPVSDSSQKTHTQAKTEIDCPIGETVTQTAPPIRVPDTAKTEFDLSAGSSPALRADDPTWILPPPSADDPGATINLSPVRYDTDLPNVPAPATGVEVAEDAPDRTMLVQSAAGIPDDVGFSVSGDTSGRSFDAPSDASMAEAFESAAAGDWPDVAGYQILGELGRGGMGVVYKARQRGLRRLVALKMVLAGAHAGPEQLTPRFHIEAKAVAKLQHPNIVQIYDVRNQNGLPYFSLEFVDGGPLDKQIGGKAQPPRQAAKLVETLADAMHFAHGQGVIHRDLKPANILMTADGVPKITDFGLAKQLEEADSSQTKSGTIMGTPSYMSPEQARGEVRGVGPLSDQYSLGAMLYELLVGRPPFVGATTMETVLKVTKNEPVPPTRLQPEIPADLETICLRCLQKEPAKRYPNCFELANDLNRFLAGEPILARPIGNGERLLRWCRRNPRIAALVATVFALLSAVILMLIGFTLRLSREKDQTEIARQMAVQNETQARTAEVVAEANAERARKAQELAGEQASLALGTVYGVVTKMDEKLGNASNMGPLRQDLLQFAMKQLDKISRTVATSGKADRTMGVALHRMGEFYEQRGMTDKQIEVYERSLEIFNRLIKDQPNEDWNKFDAAISYNALGEIGRENAPDPAKVMAYYRNALQLNKEVAEVQNTSEPAPALRYRALASSYVKMGIMALEVGDPEAAQEFSAEGLKATHAAVRAGTNKAIDAWELQSALNYLLGKADFELGAEAKARAALAECIRLRGEWSAGEPTNVLARVELARANAALGDLEIRAKQVPASLQSYRKASEIFSALLAKDRDNPELQWYQANTEYALAVAQLAEGKQADATVNLRQCSKVREVLQKSDPNNIQRKIELMLVQARLGQHAEAAKIAAEVAAFAPKHPGKLFSAACGYALSYSALKPNENPVLRQDYADKAVATLRLALAAGFKNMKEISTGPDLDQLRTHLGINKLMEAITRPQGPNT